MKNRSRFLRRILAAALTAFALSGTASLTVSAELLPGLGEAERGSLTAPTVTDAPAPAQPRAPEADSSEQESAIRGSSAWGILIAVGIAALAAVVIFLIMPSREEGEESPKPPRR
jgi:hypothetical protein